MRFPGQTYVEGSITKDMFVVEPNAPKTWNEALDIVIEDFKKIMLQRHLKYGAGNINAFGEMGCLIRLSDKVERLKNALNNPNKSFGDDSIEDAWIDAGNYPIIRMMYVNNWWDLPVICDCDEISCTERHENDASNNN